MIGRERRLILDTVILGIVGALSAQAFTLLLRGVQLVFLAGIAGYQAPGLPDEGGRLQEIVGPHGLLLIPLVTTLGGLLTGFLVYTLAPEAEGHGTDAVIKAYHRAGGYIRARVPPLKLVASAITIGTGGSAGREGPTALITAGIGSLYGSFLKRPHVERRALALIGMAAGVSAMFRSPLGAALFAIEVLYSDMELEAGVLLYTILGSVVAYAVNGMFVGWHALFRVPADLSVPTAPEHLWYAVLGVASGVVATLLPLVFYHARDMFHSLPLSPKLKPALGALGVGLMALGLPHVLGGGYGWIQEAMDGRLARALFTLIFAKILALSLTISSGGSGGVFAPSLFIGGMLGGALAQVFHLDPAAFVLAGMAAVFGGAARTPIASIIMMTEMTGGYHMLPATALAVTTSYFVQRRLSRPLRYPTLYEAQVPRRVDSPAHHAEHLQAALRLLGEREGAGPTVLVDAAVRHSAADTLPRTTTLRKILDHLVTAKTSVVAVVDAGARYRGLISIEDLEAIKTNLEVMGTAVIAEDLIRKNVPTIAGDAPLASAFEVFENAHTDALPVVRGDGSFVGFLHQADIVPTYRRAVLHKELVAALPPPRTSGSDSIGLPSGVAVGEVPVPAWLVGKTLTEANLRERFGVAVLALVEAGGGRAYSDPGVSLKAGERLVVLCSETALLELREGREPPPAPPAVVEAVAQASSRLRPVKP